MNTKEYISSGIIESYLLGQASSEEAGILECVMQHNIEVREAFEEAQQTIEQLASAQAVAPPKELKEKIWNKIQQEQNIKTLSKQPIIPIKTQEKDSEIKSNEPRSAQSKMYSWRNLAIAASLLFLVSIGANVYWRNSQTKLYNELAQLRNENNTHDMAMQSMQQKLLLFNSPDIRKIVLKGVENHAQAQAIVLWHETSKEVYLTVNNLPKAPQGMQYQLWAIVDGKPVNAGMYSQDKDGLAALSTIPNAQAFAITLEKEGGSTAPTMENMYVMGEVSG